MRVQGRLAPGPSSSLTTSNPTMAMYFRHRYRNFEEFQRAAFDAGEPELGKEELDLLDELWVDEERFEKPLAQRRRSHVSPGSLVEVSWR